MSRTVKRHKYWLVPVCTLVAGIVFLCGYPQLHAQTPMAGTPGATAGAPAAPATGEPTIVFGAVMSTGVKREDIKNWDGTVTSFLRFKYKTLDNRVVTVHLPAMYTEKTQMKTRAAWDTLFQCYSMDVEAEIALKEDKMYSIAGEVVGKMLDNMQKQMPADDQSSGNPASGAMDSAKMNMPAIGADSMSLPPLLF